MGDITQLLDRARHGDSAARERFFAGVYAELDQLARRKIGRPDRFTMLDAPGLVHEVYLRLAQQADLPGNDRRSFLAYASRAMRSVIIDYVRSRKAERHGGDCDRVTLNTGIAGQSFKEPDLLALGDAMESLQRIDERAHWVVEMRYLGGLSEAEIAESLGVTTRTVRRDWEKARLLLAESLK